MTTPVVSVIVPVYNTERYLARCLDSLINQTQKNIEILVIDDCSDDNSISIIQQFFEKDQRIKLIRHSENRGLGYTRNTGIKSAKGEYLMFVDSDDFLEPNAVENLYEIAVKHDLDILEGNYRKIMSNKSFIYPKYNVKGTFDGNEYISKAGYLDPLVVNKFWKREFILKNHLFFTTDKMFYEDNFFTYKAFLKAQKVRKINFIFYNYVIRQNSIMTSAKGEKHIKSSLNLIKGMEKIFLEGYKKKGNRVRFKYFMHTVVLLQIMLDQAELSDSDKEDAIRLVRKIYRNYNKKIITNPRLWSIRNLLFAFSPKLAKVFVKFLIKIRS